MARSLNFMAGLTGMALALGPDAAQAGPPSPAPGTQERQASGDCSGYRVLTKKMAAVAIDNGREYPDFFYVEGPLAGDQRVEVWHDSDGVVANLLDKSSFPTLTLLSATTSSSSDAPNSPCASDISRFMAAVDSLRDRARLTPNFSSPESRLESAPAQEAASAQEGASPVPTQEVEVAPQVQDDNERKARSVLEQMQQNLGLAECEGARFLSEPRQIDTPDDLRIWTKRDRRYAALQGGWEAEVVGVSSECYVRAKTNVTEQILNGGRRVGQYNSSCFWGGVGSKFDPTVMRWAAQCFDSVEEKRKKFPEPLATLGIQ